MDVLTKTTLLYLLLLLIKKSSSLDNGLALTPPMGWMSWERFRCVTDCDNDPRNCISERLYIEMADAMLYGGFREAGYRYVCIDDCWTAMNRTKDGRLQADPKRFPSGIKWLADYVHARGLKLGIYADYGTKTCEGYPGSIKHIETDAQTFAEWGVDYLKLDGCYANPPKMDEGYPKFTRALNKTGRPIVFSCSWPAYQVFMNITPNYEKIAKHCNLWRNYGDIQDSFKSVVDIFSWFGDNQDDLIPAAGKGHWNDPDMLIIGNFGLSYEQSKLQFALWAIMASPLLMSNDLRDIDSRSKEILLNREIIDVNQDSLGKQGKRVVKNETSFTEIWFRPLSVCCSVSVVLLSLRSDLPVVVEASFNDVGISTKRAYARDLFAHQDLGIFEKSFKAKVNPSGVVMVKLTPICDSPEISAKKTSKKKKEKAEESKKTEKAKGEKTKEESKRKKKKGKMTEKESGEKSEKKAQEKSKKPKKKKGEETKEESEKKKKERKKSEKEPKKSEKKEGEKAKEESKKSKKEKGAVKAKKESKKEKNEGKENKEELEKKSKKAKEESKETNKKKGEETAEKSVKKTVKKEGEKTEEESKKTAKRNSEETDSEEKPGKKKVEKTGKEHKNFSEKVNERDERKRCHCCVRPVARN